MLQDANASWKDPTEIQCKAYYNHRSNHCPYILFLSALPKHNWCANSQENYKNTIMAILKNGHQPSFHPLIYSDQNGKRSILHKSAIRNPKIAEIIIIAPKCRLAVKYIVTAIIPPPSNPIKG